jgi:hypothetical protein
MEEQQLINRDLRFVEETILRIKNKNEGSNHLSIGIIYGLIMGLLGNLTISLVLELLFKNLSELTKSYILFFLCIIIMVIILIVISEQKSFKKKDDEMEQILTKIHGYLDNMDAGIKLNRNDVLNGLFPQE